MHFPRAEKPITPFPYTPPPTQGLSIQPPQKSTHSALQDANVGHFKNWFALLLVLLSCFVLFLELFQYILRIHVHPKCFIVCLKSKAAEQHVILPWLMTIKVLDSWKLGPKLELKKGQLINFSSCSKPHAITTVRSYCDVEKRKKKWKHKLFFNVFSNSWQQTHQYETLFKYLCKALLS